MSYTGINPPYAEQFGPYSNIVQCDDQIMNVHIKMELFDTHFVYFGQVLLVSGQKTLVMSYRFYKW